MMLQEELELKIDSLLAKCRTEVEITKTAEQGAMFRKGPFQISISLATKMKTYQDDLSNCRRNPYDVLLNVCTDNGWGVPVFRTVDYTVGIGFLFSVIVNDHELVSKRRDKRPLVAADLAAANFLRYLGLWVNEKNLNLTFDWEQITCDNENSSSQNMEAKNIYGYLYFMGFQVVKSETTSDETTSKSVISLRANIHLQLGKLIYTLLTSRGEKSCWLTDIDIAFYKRIFGDLKSDASYILNNESWKSDKVCSCKNKRSKICFIHEEYFFYFLLKDYFYVDVYGPVDCAVLEQLKKMKQEEEEKVKTDLEMELKETKPELDSESVLREFKEIKKEKEDEVKRETKDVKPLGLTVENSFEGSKNIKKEKEDDDTQTTHGTKVIFKQEMFNENERYKISHVRKIPTSPTFDLTETPLNLRHDLKSKIFGETKADNNVDEVGVNFELSFDTKTGVSNIKTCAGRYITIADLNLPRIPLVNARKRTPCNNITTVVTSQRKKRK